MKPRETAEHIVRWLSDYADRSGMRGYVVGLSGGVDSAVTSTLAAMTGRPVLTASMPIHQSSDQIDRSRTHTDWLESRYDNVASVEVNLSDAFDTLVAALPRADDTERLERSLVNTRARLRMTTLYYFAGLGHDLVVGTGNKVEDFGIGFFTKYGDGGVDVSPIADLNKTEVYTLGESLGIGDDILRAPPTDGLWHDNRTDEEQIGASYRELEWAMEFSGDESSLDPRQRKVLALYRRLHAANRHKMEPIPVCKIPADLR